MATYPLGKLPPDVLASILEGAPITDPRVILGPGIGLDCAIVEYGDNCLVFKSDPITFASDEIGWYAVQVNANDIATTGATPTWFLTTLLLPEGGTTTELVEEISQQIYEASKLVGISVIGGHTEITYGLDRPVVVGTMIGEVPRNQLITPQGASPGNRILLTKGVPIEGTAILAREFPERLENVCTEGEIREASRYLYDPGISVVKDAQIAIKAGVVTGMHDPTESGLAGALWELAEACGNSLVIDPQTIPISPTSQKICSTLKIDPLGTIASGALLITTPSGDSSKICRALKGEGILCVDIGWIEPGGNKVFQSTKEGLIILPRPKRDEIARIFEE
jgi:hydrogenase maturation factor